MRLEIEKSQQCPLLAESRPSNQAKLTNPNDRFREIAVVQVLTAEKCMLCVRFSPVSDHWDGKVLRGRLRPEASIGLTV